MKKLALLLLAVPLAACATPTPPAASTPEQSARLKTIQLAQAVSACSDKAVDRDYWRCVNNFTSQRYGMHVGRPDDGSVTLVDDTRGPVRAPVGKPLQEAQALAAQKNYAAAMAKISEAEAVPNQTAEEIRITAELKEYISSRPAQP
jgi:hypothetical protein